MTSRDDVYAQWAALLPSKVVLCGRPLFLVTEHDHRMAVMWNPDSEDGVKTKHRFAYCNDRFFDRWSESDRTGLHVMIAFELGGIPSTETVLWKFENAVLSLQAEIEDRLDVETNEEGGKG